MKKEHENILIAVKKKVVIILSLSIILCNVSYTNDRCNHNFGIYKNHKNMMIVIIILHNTRLHGGR